MKKMSQRYSIIFKCSVTLFDKKIIIFIHNIEGNYFKIKEAFVQTNKVIKLLNKGQVCDDIQVEVGQYCGCQASSFNYDNITSNKIDEMM